MRFLVSNRDALAALRDLVFVRHLQRTIVWRSAGPAATMRSNEAGTIIALPDGGWKYLSAGTYSTSLDDMEEALEGGVNWW
jgi:cysteine synthase B